MNKKKFRVTFTQESYMTGHVVVEADSADDAINVAGQDEHVDNIEWGEFNDGGELWASDAWEIKDE